MSNNCKEFVLDDLMAVTVIPVEDFSPGMSAWQLKPTVSADEFNPVLTNAITVGMQPAIPDGMLIPIMRNTGKAKDAENDNVSGRLHTVSVSCDVDDRDGGVWDLLLALERTPGHLLLTFRDGTRAFVQGTEDTYLCEVERDGAKTAVSLKVQCLMGVQLIVE